VLTRILTNSQLELRGDGRTVYGIAVPYDRETEVSDMPGVRYREIFRYGSFAQTINRGATNRVKLMVNHDRQKLPIGRATELTERRDGLYGEFRISSIPDGDHALELVRDGVVDSFSVGFQPVKDRDSHGVVERLEVNLREVSLVAFPAYEDALIAGLRHDDPYLQYLEQIAQAIRQGFDPTQLKPADVGTLSSAAVTPDDEPQHPRHLPKHQREARLRTVKERLQT